MLSSPIILYDYPQIAPESAGDLFDSTEIDEILTLRVQALSDTEKIEMRTRGRAGAAVLERRELAAGRIFAMHGTLREVRKTTMNSSIPAAPGDRRANGRHAQGRRPRADSSKNRRADVMDIALEGKIAMIEAVEEDVDKNVHFAVVLEDDPGRDIGLMRHVGHRFFYAADEVEPLITGPVDRKMAINALNSGAQCWMADFEDANSPTWENAWT